MSLLSKIFVVLILIVSVIYLAVTATLYAQRIDWKKKYLDKDAELKNTIQEKDAAYAELENKYNNTKADRDKIAMERDEFKRNYEGEKAKNDKLLEQYSVLSKQNEEIKSEINTLKETIKTKEERITQLEQLYAEASEDKKKLSEANIVLQGDNNSKQAEIERLKNDLTAVQNDYLEKLKQLKEIKEKIKAAGGIPEVSFQKDIDAKVLTYSSDVNVGIISAGRKHGVEKGYLFTVYRDGKYKSKIRVERVDKDFSSFVSLKDFEVESPEPGDEATTRLIGK